METVHVRYLVNDTVVEDAHTADRITYQLFDGGRAQLRLWRGGNTAEYVAYRQAERIHRVIDA